MKRVSIALLIVLCLLLTSCYSYNDINRMLFPVLIVIDVDDEGEPVVSLEIFHAYRSQKENAEAGQRILYQRRGKTFHDVVSAFEEVAGQPYSYTQNKAIVFTERAARSGVKEFLDYLHRDQQFLLRPYVAVYQGDAEELLNTEMKQNEYLGLFIFDLLDRPVERVTIPHYKLFEVLNQRRMGKNVMIVTVLTKDVGNLEDKIRKDGAAVFHNDRMMDKLELPEMKPLAFIKDIVRAGYMEVPHPNYEDKFISVQILTSNTITDILYEEEKVILRQTINLKTTMAGTDDNIVLDKKTVEQINRNAEEFIQAICHELFSKYRGKGVDVFNIQEIFERKYPRMEIDNVIEVTEYQLQVNHHLEGSTNVTSFR